MAYSLRRARNQLGKWVISSLVDHDIRTLFEDAPEQEGEEPRGRVVISGPEGHRITSFQYDTPQLFKNKDNLRNMRTVKKELLQLIREWMAFHRSGEWP